MVLEIKGVKTRVVKEKDDIVLVLIESLKKQKIVLKEKDVVVIASKIVALSQGRLLKIKGNLKKIIEKESDALLKTGFGYFTIIDGNIVANAGIDRSNVPKGMVILWPKDPYREAEEICSRLRTHFGLKKLGVIIEDSACEPLRPGVHGISIGHFGFKGIDDCRGKKDIYGKKFKVTRRAMADSLATAALILMGETDERVPFAVITGAPVSFINKHERKAVLRLKSDLFYGMYSDEFIKFASKCTK
jgi:coenzyme F420-0:L-glutamate ligase